MGDFCISGIEIAGNVLSFCKAYPPFLLIIGVVKFFGGCLGILVIGRTGIDADTGFQPQQCQIVEADATIPEECSHIVYIGTGVEAVAGIPFGSRFVHL